MRDDFFKGFEDIAFLELSLSPQSSPNLGFSSSYIDFFCTVVLANLPIPNTDKKIGNVPFALDMGALPLLLSKYHPHCQNGLAKSLGGGF
jgi:hypothetical protein